MADSKISALPASTTPLAGTEVVPLVQSSTTKKVAVTDLTAGRAVSALSFSAPTIGAESGSALSLQSNGTPGATMDTSQNIGFGTTTINGYYGSVSVPTRGVFSYTSNSTDCNAAAKGLVIRNDDTTTSNLSMLAFGTLNTGNTPIATAAVWSVNDARSSGFSTGSLHFGTNGGSGVISDRANIDATTGNFTLSVGNLVIGTSGKGIDFSADGQAAGMTSELLDDYEEGTWTPELSFGGGTTGIAYSVQAGSYTRIGNRVLVTANLILTNKGSSTGIVRISTPFSIANNNNARGGLAIGYFENITFTGQMFLESFQGTSEFRLGDCSEAGVNSASTDANFANNSIIMFSGQYYTA